MRLAKEAGAAFHSGMKIPVWFLAAAAGVHLASVAASAAAAPLFDGRTFAGWEGDTAKTWRIVDGALVGGSLTTPVPRNEFLATTRRYTNFVLRLKVKLLGTEGFVNSGVQIRSERIPNHHEMIGYQADIGEGWWGSLYDESRRNKVMAKADEEAVKKALKKDAWNEYEVRAEGRRMVIRINGVQTVDYTEADEKIPQQGLLAVQVHGGGKTEVWFKDLVIEELK